MRPPVPSLAGKRVFVTGAASGIGRATALAAAGRGADLYLTDIARRRGWRRPRRRFAPLAATSPIRAAADVADHEAVVAMAAEVHAAHGSMDVVMNVAGISTWGAIEQPRHRPLAADDRRQPDWPDQRPRVLRAADDRGRPRRPRRQRLLRRRALRPALARRLQRQPSSACAASPRCCASTSAATASASASSAPAAVKTPLVGTVRDRRRRPRDARGAEAEAALRAPRRQPRARRREDPRRHREEPLPGLHLGRHPPRLLAAAPGSRPATRRSCASLNRRLVAVAETPLSRVG